MIPLLLTAIINTLLLSTQTNYFVKAQSAATLTTTTFLPIETIDPGFFNVLQGMLGDDYDIINDVSTWNFTQIYIKLKDIRFVQGDNTTLFYSLPVGILIQLPESMLYWLGENHPEIMAYHELCTFLSNEDQVLYNCTTNSTMYEICPLPLVATNRYSLFGDGCNLACEYSNLIWGFPDEIINRLFIARIVTIILCIPCLLTVAINQYWDAKQSKEYFCQRPLMVQSQTFIILSFFSILLQWIVMAIVGEDNVLCQEALNGKRGISCKYLTYIYTHISLSLSLSVFWFRCLILFFCFVVCFVTRIIESKPTL